MSAYKIKSEFSNNDIENMALLNRATSFENNRYSYRCSIVSVKNLWKWSKNDNGGVDEFTDWYVTLLQNEMLFDMVKTTVRTFGKYVFALFLMTMHMHIEWNEVFMKKPEIILTPWFTMHLS